MGLCEQEIKEIRAILRKRQTGRITMDEAAVELAAHSLVIKAADGMTKCLLAGARHGKATLQRVLNSNLIGNNTAIDLSGESEEDLLICPQNAGPIPRSACLDHSGNPAHFDGCERCEHFRTTRRALLPAVPTTGNGSTPGVNEIEHEKGPGGTPGQQRAPRTGPQRIEEDT